MGAAVLAAWLLASPAASGPLDKKADAQEPPSKTAEDFCAKNPGYAKCGGYVKPKPEPEPEPEPEPGNEENPTAPAEGLSEPPPVENAEVPAEPAGEASPEGPEQPQAAEARAARQAALQQASVHAVTNAAVGRAYFNLQSRGLESVPAAGPGGRAASAFAPGGRSGDPSNPKTVADLHVAAASGFAASFKALGLKPGRSPSGEPVILRQNGTPASAAEVAALTARIRSEPRALMKRPDFYTVIPRESFDALKKTFQTRPELAKDAFKDVALSPEQRDFKFSQSCSAVSGECNRHVRLTVYEKDEDVPPEDLTRISDWVKMDGAESAAERQHVEAAAAAAAPAAGLPLAGAFARVQSMLAAVGRALGLSSGEEAGALGGGALRSSSRPAEATASAARPDPRRPGSSPVPDGLEPPAPAAARPSWLWLVVVLGLVVYRFVASRRARE